MKRGGFYLYEIMIYLAVASAFLMVLLKHGVDLISKVKKSHASAQRYHNVYATLAYITRDLRSAPCDFFDWQKIDNSECIWKGRRFDEGWFLQKGTLYKIKGTYDKQLHTWKKKKIAPMLHNVQNLKLQYCIFQGKVIDSIQVDLYCQLADGGVFHQAVAAFPQKGREV